MLLSYSIFIHLTVMDRSEIALKSVIDSCYTFLHALCVVIPSMKSTGFKRYTRLFKIDACSISIKWE